MYNGHATAGIYNDLNGLESIKALNHRHRDRAVDEVARQFEALLLQRMLSSMRAAGEVFSEGSPFYSSETKLYQDMLDQQLTVTLSQQGGIGLAEVIRRQLDPMSGPSRQPRAEVLPSRSPRTSGEPAAAKETAAQEAVADTWSVGHPDEFVRTLFPLAERTAAELGVPAEVLLSQAALETGWGRHVLRNTEGRPSFNFFNIKAGSGWQGEVVTVPTLEYREGVAVREWAAFRVYESPEDSFADYAALVKNSPRYGSALAVASDPRRYLHELAAAGYATDPNYAEKVLAVMNSELLTTESGS